MRSVIKIFYIAVFDRQGKSITVGGIQNYLIGLSEIFRQNNYDVVIFQAADKHFKANYKGNKIIGIKTNKKDSFRKQIGQVFHSTRQELDKNDIIIWGSDKLAQNTNHEKTIAIQHGISFDYIPYHTLKPEKLWRTNFFGSIYKILQGTRSIIEFGRCKRIVCVDYNYLNWIRAVMPRNFSEKAVVIPNYATPSERQNITFHDNKIIKILFARRFEFMRGVPVIIDVIKLVLAKYDNVEFTICGEGSWQGRLEEEFKTNPNVTITKFKVGEAEKINLEHHITLVPTYGSEGTSFSLLEGMAAGAVPIASNVGGMTNIIINGFNGYLVDPNPHNFFEKICLLIEDKNIMKEISCCAKQTVDRGFSKEIWKWNWINLIEKIDGHQKDN